MTLRTYPEGVTCWVDLATEDLDEAAGFYSALFGWTFTDAAAGSQYLIAQRDGLDAAGITRRPEASASGAGWSTYISVRDVAETVDRVRQSGGRITEPATNLADSAITASCVDPEGTGFRLWQARARHGAQVANTPGAWNFSDLHTGDASAAVAFYGGLFGWVFDDLGFATMIRQPGFGDHLAATSDPGIHERQSGDSVPPGFADAFGWLVVGQGEDPHWHVTFTVADRDDAAATAERLGATVRSSTDTEWTRDVQLRDPQGALLTLSQYLPPG